MNKACFVVAMLAVWSMSAQADLRLPGFWRRLDSCGGGPIGLRRVASGWCWGLGWWLDHWSSCGASQVEFGLSSFVFRARHFARKRQPVNRAAAFGFFPLRAHVGFVVEVLSPARRRHSV
jgi:hypothetical protein